MQDEELRAAWDAALERYREVPAARFNVTLLEQLRPRWEQVVCPRTSMFRLLFIRAGTAGNPYEADARVQVELEVDRDERVRMEFVRQVPRRGETRPAGPVTVTGDFTRPENALPAVEALLYQLATPPGT